MRHDPTSRRSNLELTGLIHETVWDLGLEVPLTHDAARGKANRLATVPPSDGYAERDLPISPVPELTSEMFAALRLGALRGARMRSSSSALRMAAQWSLSHQHHRPGDDRGPSRRQAVEAAGWSVARDGTELAL